MPNLDAEAPNTKKSLLLIGALCLPVLIAYKWRGGHLPTRWFDPDEWQHLHSAWCLAQGQVPYKDYFEHHTPMLYFLLAPILSHFRPELDMGHAWRAVLFCRYLMWVATGSVLLLVVALGARWRNLTVGVFAAAVLSGLQYFWQKAPEIRADGWATALVLAALLLSHVGSGRPEERRWRSTKVQRWSCFFSGVAISLALMFTQKTIFAAFALSGFWVYYLIDPRFPLPRKERIVRLLLVGAGGVGPIAIVLLWFLRHGALERFYYFNFAFNTGWKPHFSAIPGIKWLLLTSPWIGAGVPWLIGCTVRRAAIERRDALITVTMLSTAAALFVYQDPYLQCYQPVLPLACLAAADFIVWLLGRLPVRAAGSAALAAIASLMVWQGQRYRVSPFEVGFANVSDRNALEWVMDHSKPGEVVLTGWPMYSAFRPHPGFYWTLQKGVVEMMPPQEIEQFSADFSSGKLRPKIISMKNFAQLAPQLVFKAMDEYEPNEMPDVSDLWLLKAQPGTRASTQ